MPHNMGYRMRPIDEKICVMMDESNVLDSSFLERINTLLANGEIPGLFEGDDLKNLMRSCRSSALQEGVRNCEVMSNLHIVFTMNPPVTDLHKEATTSPALFNRCVVNWFGNWSLKSAYQVALELTQKLDIDLEEYDWPYRESLLIEDLEQPLSHRHTVVYTLVVIYQTIVEFYEKLKSNSEISKIFIGPRDLVDLIHNFKNIMNQKSISLEEQQRHLINGVKKIEETYTQVEKLQKSLNDKGRILEKKTSEANEKLKQMIERQKEAEKQKANCEIIHNQLEENQIVIEEKQKSVAIQLSQVEPAVIEAKQAVKSIKRQHLVELRSMSNPPALVKLALESICSMMGETVTDWRSIRAFIINENFIPNIINFNYTKMTATIRNQMIVKYIDNPDYKFEKINRASVACGPMVRWVIAQLDYSIIINQVAPLRNELKKLEDTAKEEKSKIDETNRTICTLEESITVYKEEYASLISDVQTIKQDLKIVQSKVDRSVLLLTNLSEEKSRWSSSNDMYKNNLKTLIGDSVLNAAKQTFCGYFDQEHRGYVSNLWTEIMKS
ncbi:hypothetical protein A3Q56_08198, partial [Intoshia linei]